MLFTFPSRYWFAIGLSEVFSLTGWAPQFQTGFHVSRPTQDTAKLQNDFVYGTFTLYGPLSSGFHFHLFLLRRGPTTPWDAETTMVWALARSLATTYAIILIFSSCGYLDVLVPHVRSPCGVTGLQPAGLPHLDISGLKVICTSPELVAAYHVLLRLREPRHPPSTLTYFCSPGNQLPPAVYLSLLCST